MDYKITTEPVAEPVTLAKAKEHLNVATDITADDDYITSLITAARQWCEDFHGWAYMVRTITAKLDSFKDTIELPCPPLVSVSSITYIDSNGDTQTLDSSVYDVDTTSRPGKITLAYNQSWPTIRSQHHAITITYIAGYACTFTAVVDDTITVYGRTFDDEDKVRLVQGDTLPTGLAENINYYVRDVSGSTLKLETSIGGGAVDITGAGTAPNYIGIVPLRVLQAMKLLIGHLYEHREMINEGSLIETPMATKNLLSDRIVPI